MVRNEDFNKTIICSKILKSYIDGVLYEIKESEGIYRYENVYLLFFTLLFMHDIICKNKKRLEV